MNWISDNRLRHLREIVDRPDFSATKYELISEIARGGMGVVYLATDTELARQVAIKVLQTAEMTPEMQHRMRREAEIIARLEHPGIVPVHDVGALADGRVYYVMKYVRGRRLDEHLDGHIGEEQMLNERLRMYRTACEAVAFAHAHGVIHRDLKPENIMVGPFGEVLVMDWGIAKLLDAAEEISAATASTTPGRTGHGVVMGTPDYMPPEQAGGESERVDRRSDVYSLGAILRFMLSSAQQPQRMPKRLEAICRKAMSPDREERYDDAQALAAEIDRYLDDRPVLAYRDNLLERLARAISRHRFIVLLVLAYILMRVILIFAAGR